MDTIRDLGAVVRARRHELGVSQEELSRRAGVSRPWLSRVEAGRHPRAEMQKILDVLGALELDFTLSPARPRGDAVTDDDPFRHHFGGGS